MTGGPISDAQILQADEREVTFLACDGKTPGGEDKQVPVTLPIGEFVLKWCLHIQPEQLTKTRYFGGWSNSQITKYQDRRVREMDAAGVAFAADGDEFPPLEDAADNGNWQSEGSNEGPSCPHCGHRSLRFRESWAQPSWRDVFRRSSESCPAWYAQSLAEDDRAFWDAAMGDGFSDWYDWYLETQVESAQAPARHGPTLQPLLPGLCDLYNEAIESS